jgi:hypothetical protein
LDLIVFVILTIYSASDSKLGPCWRWATTSFLETSLYRLQYRHELRLTNYYRDTGNYFFHWHIRWSGWASACSESKFSAPVKHILILLTRSWIKLLLSQSCKMRLY